MKKIITLLVLLSISFSFGQTTIKKSSLSSGGGVVTQGNTTVLYTVGEIAVQENTVGTVHLSEGFIGPDMAQLLGIQDYTQLEGVSAFPNPVQDHLNVTYSNYNNYETHLFDLNGKELLKVNVEDDTATQLNLSEFKTGMYIMTIIDRTNKKATTIKIQKL
jgi:hypothetical protein